ncbi:hypothetical protein E4U56_003663 [Claviceps arundinis]|uniref:Uncharacterized protein n=1 Tax=Claviceps arundinis TaxID=1623583 RepID=A0A9P7MPQ7_9HYPO|nr:hypothetical protein E4U56_003663 [Claviceps arundinis]
MASDGSDPEVSAVETWIDPAIAAEFYRKSRYDSTVFDGLPPRFLGRGFFHVKDMLMPTHLTAGPAPRDLLIAAGSSEYLINLETKAAYQHVGRRPLLRPYTRWYDTSRAAAAFMILGPPPQRQFAPQGYAVDRWQDRSIFGLLIIQLLTNHQRLANNQSLTNNQRLTRRMPF